MVPAHITGMTTTVSADVTRLGTVTPITAAPSYSLNLANESRWCDFTVPCYDIDAATALAAELDRLGLPARARAAAVTVRYNAAAPVVADLPTNVAMVAICGEFADVDQLMEVLCLHEETPVSAEVFIL